MTTGDLYIRDALGRSDVGEASGMKSDRAGEVRQTESKRPSAESTGEDYYGRPVLKAPVWAWYIPAYFWVGGCAGAAATLGAATTLAGGAQSSLARACRTIAFGGTTVGAALLVADLGRPSRFVYMLRVFRPRSAMSVGSWILVGAGATTAAALLESPVQRAATIASGVFGPALASYTGVLLANTAVPTWQAARRTLPPLFAAGGLAGAAALLELFDLDDASLRTLRRFQAASRALELAAALLMKREVEHRAPEAHVHLKQGRAGALFKVSTVLTGAALVGALLPGSSRNRRIVTGLLGTIGAIAMRYAVSDSGTASAKDPKASFAPQRRAKLGSREERALRHEAVTSPSG